MKLYTFVTCLILLVFSPQLLSACSCAGPTTFCEGMPSLSSLGLVIFGEKTKDKSDGMHVKVLTTFHGETSSDEVFIRSGNGADCGVWTGQFEVGEQFILSLYPYNNDVPTSAYYMSICGVNWLKVENGKVKGSIAPGVTEIAVDEFTTIADCGDFVPLPSQHATINVFPNPATVAFQVDIELENAIYGSFNIYDMAGRFIEQVAIEGTDEVSIPYPVEKLPTGIYLVEVQLWTRRELFKIVVGP